MVPLVQGEYLPWTQKNNSSKHYETVPLVWNAPIECGSPQGFFVMFRGVFSCNWHPWLVHWKYKSLSGFLWSREQFLLLNQTELRLLAWYVTCRTKISSIIQKPILHLRFSLHRFRKRAFTDDKIYTVVHKVRFLLFSSTVCSFHKHPTIL